MKNTNQILLICLLGIIFTQPIFAQTDIKAQQILIEAYTNYKTYKNVKMSFTVINEHKERNLYQSFDGVGYVSGNKHIVDFPEQQITSDGNNVWTYYKKTKQIHINQYNPNDGLITPDEIFREDFLTNGLTYRYIEDKTKTNDITTSKKILDQIEFTPKDKKRKYTKFIVWIDRETKLMTSWKVFLNNGGTTTYKVKITPNVNLAPDFFTFDKKKYPEGVQINDFRKN